MACVPGCSCPVCWDEGRWEGRAALAPGASQAPSWGQNGLAGGCGMSLCQGSRNTAVQTQMQRLGWSELCHGTSSQAPEVVPTMRPRLTQGCQVVPLVWGGGTPCLPQTPRAGWTSPWTLYRVLIGGHQYYTVPGEVATGPLAWGPQPSPASPSWGSPLGCCWLVVGVAPWGRGAGGCWFGHPMHCCPPVSDITGDASPRAARPGIWGEPVWGVSDQGSVDKPARAT